ncbi:phage virion morphogenesis protein [Psychromonas hadalis]|uniref:phage virion morphogenesis protein n=1 Tax=Psychromonas hadalis TaxID=211669 RepID=UPI0003B6E26A|nr:phage virion morphogenesis protein [Psychromonas hadalis]
MEIKTPEQLVALLEQVTLTGKAKQELNRVLANHTRRFFRGQISSQRDVEGKAYKPRQREVKKIDKNGKITTKLKMFMGINKNLKTEVSADNFSVGLAGGVGRIAMIHNEGDAVNYSVRVGGFFNKESRQWEGGDKRTGTYQMPKRTMVGWTPELQHKLTQIIFQHMQPKG